MTILSDSVLLNLYWCIAKLYRNYGNKKQLQVNPLGRTSEAGSYHQLLRLDQNKQYTFFEWVTGVRLISTSMQSFFFRPFGSCHAIGLSSVASSLDQPMWGWIKNARFSGVKRFRQQKVNMWTYTVSLVSYYYYTQLYCFKTSRITRPVLSTH
jgi:hypothetical protein